MARLTAQDAFDFLLAEFEKSGMRMQPNQRNILLQRWAQHVEAKKNEKKAKPTEASENFTGFATGDVSEENTEDNE